MEQERDGPVQFEKDTGALASDPFKEVDDFLSKVDGSGPTGGGDGANGGGKRYGMQDSGESRAKKRARVDEDDDER